MKNYFINTIFSALTILSVIATSCNTTEKPKEITKTKDSLINVSQKNSNQFQSACVSCTYNQANEYNVVTDILSGNKNKQSALIKLYDSLYWQHYHTFLDSSWKRIKNGRLNNITSWRNAEVVTSDTLTHTIFYPFSGPDFLTVSAFFPKADTFVMLGLEPIGTLPEINKLNAKQQKEYIYSFKQSLNDIFQKSYFITKKMLQDFQAQKVNGSLPVLCFFIKRMNYDITDIHYIIKDSTNQVKEITYNEKIKNKPFGVKVTAIKDGCCKTIYYYRYNVIDKNFNDSIYFYNYLKKFNHYITYIKSASYLLHNPFMSNMRNLILNNSVAILQDDTGMPFRYLSDALWNTKLYGEYAKPVSDFPYLSMQKEILEKIQKDSSAIKKLPFHLGYHWGSKKDILIWSVKKKA